MKVRSRQEQSISIANRLATARDDIEKLPTTLRPYVRQAKENHSKRLVEMEEARSASDKARK